MTEQPQTLQFDIQKIYLQDVSLESPNAPVVFTRDNLAPELDVQINISHQELDGDNGFYNVVLEVTVTATEGEHTIFLIEVHQAGVFRIVNIKESELPLALEVAAPNVLLPFAREAVSDLAGKGGFPQLLINPVNFEALYQQHHNKSNGAGDKEVQISTGDEAAEDQN
ncbi:MAG TPA: protein-export chaperone SecB [Gammaproteobacteria bacterium]|nr:protein-export chaperone SecB [Gammaproteobacteria bacterium]